MAENSGESESVSAPARCPSTAAVKIQKFYRGYRTRRMLVLAAVFVEPRRQALENHSTIPRRNSIKLNVSKVDKAQKLALQHWLEAVDPRHRNGRKLHFYYNEWLKTDDGQPFFYWLDIGYGKYVNLKNCPRSKLCQCITYLGPKEREYYEFVVVDGLILHKLTWRPLDTKGGPPGSKWIFVMSTSKKLYIGEEKKGLFHHSSFLAGGATLAAGSLISEDGVLKCISAYGGHYEPIEDCFDSFLSFLKENRVNLFELEIHKTNDDYDTNKS